MGFPLNATYVLIAVNLVLFVLTYFLKLDISNLFALYLPKNPNFGAWQFLSHMFIHGGVTHIVFNMYALWAFGTPLQKYWGNTRFVLFFLATGLGAGLFYTAIHYLQFTNLYNEIIALKQSPEAIQYLLDTRRIPAVIGKAIDIERLKEFWSIYNNPVVGASGAIYGILVAFAVMFPQAKLSLLFIPYPIKAMHFVPVIICIDLFFIFTDFSMGNVAHVAHVGGALMGLIIMLIWKQRIKQRVHSA